jgi:hypothetical protein
MPALGEKLQPPMRMNVSTIGEITDPHLLV